MNHQLAGYVGPVGIWPTFAILSGMIWLTMLMPGNISASSEQSKSMASDMATCGGLAVTIRGTPGDDILVGSEGPDVIHGLEGNDVIDGLGGDDVICGGPGKDVLRGFDGDDKLYGQSGDDTLNGGDGNDRLYGGEKYQRLATSILRGRSTAG